MSNKINFLTFSNTGFMSCDNIIRQAKEFNIFDELFILNENDIPEYIEKHKDFITNNKPGYGLWIWKPKIIFDTLNKLNENDILVYSDAGMYLNKDGIERFKEYLTKLTDNKYIITFSTNDSYRAQQYVKNDAIMSYYPEFNNKWSIACYAGIMIIKKNIKSLQLINDWLLLCENYHFIDKSPSIIHKDLPHYVGNDYDNGLFNLCLLKYDDIVEKIYPDEINIYIGNRQAIHITNIIEDEKWNVLNKIPFQCRRMTPKFGFNKL